MNITDLVDSDLLSFNVDYQNLYIEFLMLTEDRQKVKVSAYNADLVPILVRFTGLKIRSDLTTVDNVPSLGEIESVTKTTLGFNFEGDMGFIEVEASQCNIEVL